MWYCWKRKIAIEKLQNNTYDIVLMDIQMPEINGFEATEFIRKKWNLKFHYCSNGRCYNYRHQKSLEIGMNDYISKPIDENYYTIKLMNYWCDKSLNSWNVNAIKIRNWDFVNLYSFEKHTTYTNVFLNTF
jgi:CheY-like chemotaxis protein